MQAVIVTGGKQYRVNEGQVLKIETLSADIGQTVNFEQVLLVSDGDAISVGAPYVEKAKVQAEVLAHGRHPKIKIIKFRRRKHHMKHMGHRQNFTEVKITKIKA